MNDKYRGPLTLFFCATLIGCYEILWNRALEFLHIFENIFLYFGLIYIVSSLGYFTIFNRNLTSSLKRISFVLIAISTLAIFLSLKFNNSYIFYPSLFLNIFFLNLDLSERISTESNLKSLFLVTLGIFLGYLISVLVLKYSHLENWLFFIPCLYLLTLTQDPPNFKVHIGKIGLVIPVIVIVFLLDLNFLTAFKTFTESSFKGKRGNIIEGISVKNSQLRKTQWSLLDRLDLITNPSTENQDFIYFNGIRWSPFYSKNNTFDQFGFSPKGNHALIIGAGGGNEVKLLEEAGFQSIYLNEMHSDLTDLLRKESKDLVSDIYNRYPISASDGRAFIRSHARKFDFISIVNLGFVGNFLLPNFLTTKEAFREIWEKLSEEGQLFLKFSYKNHPHHYSQKFFSTIKMMVKEDIKEKDPNKLIKIFKYQNEDREKIILLLFKTPPTPTRLKRISESLKVRLNAQKVLLGDLIFEGKWRENVLLDTSPFPFHSIEKSLHRKLYLPIYFLFLFLTLLLSKRNLKFTQASLCILTGLNQAFINNLIANQLNFYNGRPVLNFLLALTLSSLVSLVVIYLLNKKNYSTKNIKNLLMISGIFLFLVFLFSYSQNFSQLAVIVLSFLSLFGLSSVFPYYLGNHKYLNFFIGLNLLSFGVGNSISPYSNILFGLPSAAIFTTIGVLVILIILKYSPKKDLISPSTPR